MACGARSGLKQHHIQGFHTSLQWLNGLWSPFGIETFWRYTCRHEFFLRLNGLWSPFGIETDRGLNHGADAMQAKWPVEPVRD